MARRKQQYRIPDFEVKEPGGRSIIEYENTPKTAAVIQNYIRDYKVYYYGYKIYFVVKPGRENFYKQVCEHENLRHYSIGVFEDKQYIEKVKIFNPQG